MNEAQLKALLRKTQAAAAAAKPKKNRTYDATLDATRGRRRRGDAKPPTPTRRTCSPR